MILNFVAFHDRTAAQLKAGADPFVAQGFRFNSIAIYGDPQKPLFAASMLLRDHVVAQEARWNLDTNQFKAAFDEMAGKGFAPTVVSATGTTSHPRFAVIFEPAPNGIIPRTLVNINQQTFDQENSDARARGEMLRSVAIYGSPGSNRLYGATWCPNSGKVNWNVFTDLDLATDQQIFDAMISQRGRPSFTARSSDGRYASLYQDDSVGSSAAVSELNSAQYQQKINELTSQGFFPLCVQAGGSPASQARFTAIFAVGEDILPRKFSVTGESLPELKPLDDLMELGMKKSGTRAASLALAYKGRVIHARAYTWAEPDYPLTQPGSLFRVASVSKAITAMTAVQLIDQGKMKADDLIQPLLKLTPPPGKSFSGSGWVDQIKVTHLLNHLSGLYHTDPNVEDVAAAFGHSDNFTLTKEEFISFALCDMKFQPGGPVPTGVDNYSNTGYTLLGMFIAAKTGMTYEQAVKTFLFKPLNITTARIGKSLAQERAPGEVFYHSTSFTVGKSRVTSERPMVATQYGTGGEMFLLDGGGGWIISAADFARLLAALDRSPANPIFSKPETTQTLFACGVWEGVSPFENGKNAAGNPTNTRCKGGGFAGTGSVMMHREDNLSVAAFENYDFWPSDAEMSLSGVPNTFHNFQINERLNLLTKSAAYPFSLSRRWRVNSNSFVVDLIIETIDESGNLKGKIKQGTKTDPVNGVWNKSEGKLTFTRQTVGGDASSMQIYTGYLMANENRLAGSFKAFPGTGGKAHRSVFGWVAWLPDSI
ncbi:MAG: serine hydrolase [Acidobacteria bacterium]|nr:serine hydrolase [Acidobacteriota bacterium]